MTGEKPYIITYFMVNNLVLFIMITHFILNAKQFFSIFTFYFVKYYYQHLRFCTKQNDAGTHAKVECNPRFP